MKLAALVFLSVLSVTSWAVLPEGSFKGGGKWMSPDKSTGTWTESMIVKKDGNAVIVESHVQVFNNGIAVHQDKTTLRFESTGGGFFNVKNGDKAMGAGYCFDNICHYDFNNGKETGEETIHLHQGNLYKMGSQAGEEKGVKYKVAWHGKLEKN